MSTSIRLPFLTLLIALALVADSTLTDWLRVHWDVALSGLIVIIGGLWVSTSTGLSTTGDAIVSGGIQVTGIGGAAAGKIGLNANQLAFLGGSSGHGFYNSGGGLTTSVDPAGTWSFTAAQRLTGVISPPTLTTDEHNYAPTGLSTARIIRIDASGGDGNHSLTGLAAQPAGTVLSIAVTLGVLNIAAENGSSTAANRLGFSWTVGIALDTPAGITIWYDGASSRWRMIG